MKTGLYTIEKADDGDLQMVHAGSRSRAEKRHAKLVETHVRNEAKLARAMRAWDKSREALRRAEKKLDKEWGKSA